jgi:hypothetical protein
MQLRGHHPQAATALDDREYIHVNDDVSETAEGTAVLSDDGGSGQVVSSPLTTTGTDASTVNRPGYQIHHGAEAPAVLQSSPDPNRARTPQPSRSKVVSSPSVADASLTLPLRPIIASERWFILLRLRSPGQASRRNWKNHQHKGGIKALEDLAPRRSYR